MLIYAQGGIVLSFAPSAAAGWHGERQRIPYARNRARHSVFFSVGLCRRFLGTVPPVFTPKKFKQTRRNARIFLVRCLRFSHPKYLKKTRRNARLFFSHFRHQNCRFLVDFGVISRPGAPLEPSGLPFCPGGIPGRIFDAF